MKTRRIGAVASALVASFALAACGSQGGAKSYTALTQANFAQSISDAIKGSTSVHMTLTAAASHRQAQADWSFGTPPAVQMTITSTTSSKTNTLVLRLIDTMLYMQVPPATPAGKWVQFNTKALGTKAADQYKNLSPQDFATQFKSGIQSIKYMGTAQVNGQSARHYELVADTSKLSSSLKALVQDSTGAAAAKTVDEQVYLNNDNLLQQMVLALPAPVGTVVIDFTAWNAPVSIKAPAKADITNPGE